ncbi:MAG: hypothetical protein ACPGU6_07445 [Tenacibaculum sp.]
MKKRKMLQLVMVLVVVLFFICCYVDWNMSIIVMTILIFSLVFVKVFEIIRFFLRKKTLLKLGRIELFEKKMLNGFILIGITFLLYFFIKNADLIDFRTNDFTTFFLGNTGQFGMYYIIIVLFNLKNFIDDQSVFYLTDKGLVTRGNYFESYFWNDFLGYKIIKEQSLIRFKKKNGKFLFITYDESLQGKEELIIESLSKNLTEDVKNINHRRRSGNP